MSTTWAVILPSRDEAKTIGGVTKAVAQALGEHGVIINVDYSSDEETRRAFLAKSSTVKRHYVRAALRGKGAQVLHGLKIAREEGAGAALMLDTDVRNPSVALYRSLMDAVAQSPGGLAASAYRRLWYEGNLTNHVARPLLAAGWGVDLPQPLAGDFGLSAALVDAVLAARSSLPKSSDLAGLVDGYGIDMFVVSTAVISGYAIRSVASTEPKLHAPSFAHLPQIYREVVPVILRMVSQTGRKSPTGRAPHGLEVAHGVQFDLEPATLSGCKYEVMQKDLAQLGLGTGVGDSADWAAQLANAWRSSGEGIDLLRVTEELWPAYLARVSAYLAQGHHGGVSRASACLAEAVATLQSLLQRG